MRGWGRVRVQPESALEICKIQISLGAISYTRPVCVTLLNVPSWFSPL